MSGPWQICIGKFRGRQTEMMVGCQDGGLYLIRSDLREAELYSNVGYTITQILSLDLPGTSLSAVAASGHWNGVKVLHEGKVSCLPTPPIWKSDHRAEQ